MFKVYWPIVSQAVCMWRPYEFLVDVKPVPRLVGSFSRLIYEGLTESDGLLSILAPPCRKHCRFTGLLASAGPKLPPPALCTHLSISMHSPLCTVQYIGYCIDSVNTLLKTRQKENKVHRPSSCTKPSKSELVSDGTIGR